MEELQKRLQQFCIQHKINSKGALALILVLTRRVSTQSPPFSPESFLTAKGGQVAKIGRNSVQSILADHGINRVLAEEGGRTSRGSIQNMRAYLSLLNEAAQEGPINFKYVEEFWVTRVREYFRLKPFMIKVDSSRSLISIVADLIEAAYNRQKENPGVMVAGAVMQHLVGAKLETALPNTIIEHQGFSVADSPTRRKGDFQIADTAIHVTAAPSEALLRKCSENLTLNLRPMIITTKSGAGGAAALAKNANIFDRIDILEIEQFVATNLYEQSGFLHSKRTTTIRQLIDAYNKIIDKCETDPSLKISMG